MTTFTDTFDGASTDLTWVSARGTARPTVNGDGTASIGGSGWQYARVEHDTGSADMYAEVVIDSGGTGEILVFVRATQASQGTTAAETYISAVLNLTAGDTWMSFLEWAGPGAPVGFAPFGEIDEPVSLPPAPFTFRFEAEGDEFRGYLDGVLVKTETHNGDPSGGRAGLGLDTRTGSSVVRFDEWRTGALSDPPPTTAPALTSTWLGIDTVLARTTGEAGDTVRVAFSTSSGMTGPVYSTTATPDSRGTTRHAIPTSLAPAAAHWYQVERGGTLVGAPRAFRTLPAAEGAASYSFGFASCRDHIGDAPILADAIGRGISFFVQQGDIHYRDIIANNEATFHAAYDEFHTRTQLNNLLTTVPTTYTWSDHDGPLDGTSSALPAVQTVYRARVPHPPLPSTAGIYHTFRLGRVRFIVLDTRSYASPSTNTEGSGKTKLGTAQRAWLQGLLSAPDTPLTMIVSAEGWIGGVDPGDHWGLYQTERTLVGGWIAASDTRCVMLCGDAHMLAYDDGRNAVGGVTVWHAAALARSGSVKGGPYSGGTLAGSGQYGYVEIDDTGTQITATYRGIRSDTSVWGTHTVTVATPTTAAEAQGWGDPLPVSDEFDTPGPPDPARWAVYGAGGDVGGDECWVGHDGNGRRCVSQAVVTADGYLRLAGTADGDTGALSHQFDQQYGRWEVRARILAEAGATGNPYHGVLIVWPWSNKWPVHGEYDFLEVDVGDTSANAWLHYPHPGPVAIQQEQGVKAGVDVAQWHNYALEWTPTSLVGYLDGVEWFRFSDGEGPNGRGPIQGMPAGHLTLQLDNFFPDAGLQAAYLDAEWARVYPPPTPGPGVRVVDVGDPYAGAELVATAEELGSGITARSWTVTSGPTAVGAVLSTSTTLSWTPTLPGDYEIEYLATNVAGSSADQLRVTVRGPDPGRMLLAT